MQRDWGATKEHMLEDIECPICEARDKESKVTVFWVSHGKDSAVLRCICDRGHQFEETVMDAS